MTDTPAVVTSEADADLAHGSFWGRLQHGRARNAFAAAYAVAALVPW